MEKGKWRNSPSTKTFIALKLAQSPLLTIHSVPLLEQGSAIMDTVGLGFECVFRVGWEVGYAEAVHFVETWLDLVGWTGIGKRRVSEYLLCGRVGGRR